jgi:hypothetical protein
MSLYFYPKYAFPTYTSTPSGTSDGMGLIHHRVGVPFLAQHGWKMDLDAWFNRTEAQRDVTDIIGNYAQQADT